MEKKCEMAREKLRAALDVDARTPQRVLIGTWQRFYVFDWSHVFNGKFAETAQSLLAIEGGECACMWWLDPVEERRPEAYINSETSREDLRQAIDGVDGWISCGGRVGCMSDRGEWCVVCESYDEFAILALRDRSLEAKYMDVIKSVYGVPIAEAGKDNGPYSELPTDFRRTLMSEYRDEG